MKKIPRHLIPASDRRLCEFQQIGERVAASKKLITLATLVVEAWDALTEKEQLYIISQVLNGLLTQAQRCSVLMREIGA